MINTHNKIARLVALMLLITSLAAGQDGLQVTGRIINSSNQAIPDVAVSFEGSSSAPSITDTAGYFQLNVPSGDVWLRISPVGTYKEKQVFLNGRENVTIYLANVTSRSINDEAVYVGQPRLRRNLVSTVITASPAVMSQDTYESVDQKFQGRLPGVHQVGMSGMPGSGTFMMIRGLNSINTNNQPLIIVDGMPLETPGILSSVVDGFVNNPVASIDIRDISNVTVITDGGPLASYGVKGSNGVILVETLKPAETNTSIDFQFKSGIHYFDRQIPTLNASQYKTLAKEVISTSPWGEESLVERFPGLYYLPGEDEYLRYSHSTNWQDEVFQNSLMQDAYLKVMGGDAIARYGLSVGYMNHNGIIQNTNYNRFNTRFVGTFNVFNWLRMYVSANLVSSNSKYKESGLGEQTGVLLSALHKTPQMFPYSYDQEGKLLTKIDDVDELGVSNPRAVIDNYFAENSNYRFLTSFRVEGDITQTLKWTSLLGLNINDIKERVFMPNLGMELYLDGEVYNISQSLNNLLFTMYNDNYLTYRNTYNNVHSLTLTGGMRWQTNRYQEDWGVAMNSAENDQYTTLQTGEPELRNITGDNGRWNWLSNYAGVTYSFRDKYLLDAAVSADFSTRVGADADVGFLINDRPFGLFYSIGGGWRVSGESFMAGLSSIEDMKITLNYTTSGNDDIGNYSSYAYYTLKLYRETSGMVPGGFPNRLLTYETIKQLSGGLELSLMENRMLFKGNYYRSTTDDMLIFEQLSSYMGYNIFPSNNASMEKSGFDIGIYARVLESGDFALDLGLNASHYNSTITSIPDNQIITDLPGGAAVINRVGEPANSFFGYEFNGVFATQAEANEAGLVNERGVPFGPGDAIFSDLSGPDGVPDQVINEFDKVILGSATPDYYGGASVEVFYKRFHLDLFFQGVYGNEVYNYLRFQNERMSDISNQSSAVLNRWVSDGQETNIPRASWGDEAGNSAFSSRWIEDGSYIRLKHITLSYTIPEEIWFFRNLGVFITGSNLFTASSYLSYDPEFAYSFDSKMMGIDYGLMPMGKKVMVGFKFGL